MYYQTLQVIPTAEPEVVKAAYRALIAKYHPDGHGGKPEAETKAKELNEAWRILQDPVQRKRYDTDLAFTQRSTSQSVPPTQPNYKSYTYSPPTQKAYAKTGQRGAKKGSKKKFYLIYTNMKDTNCFFVKLPITNAQLMFDIRQQDFWYDKNVHYCSEEKAYSIPYKHADKLEEFLMRETGRCLRRK